MASRRGEGHEWRCGSEKPSLVEFNRVDFKETVSFGKDFHERGKKAAAADLLPTANERCPAAGESIDPPFAEIQSSRGVPR